MNKNLLIWGGVGLVALVGGFLVLRNSGGSSDASAADAGYYPPTVLGGASSGIDAGDVSSSGGTVTSSGSVAATGSGTTTDDQIGALIQTTLAQAQSQLTATLDTNATQKAIALAGYQNTKDITSIQANAGIEQSLASQLGAIASSFVSKSSTAATSSGIFGLGGGTSSTSTTKGVPGVTGTLGYSNGVINVNLQQTPAPANTQSAKKAA